MQQAIHYRKGIPFFHDKTPLEFQRDSYEQYDNMVLRQTTLHLADELWGGYPFQPVFDFASAHYPKNSSRILEIGSGVGRWIGSLAQAFPNATCWGIDYSYQMLKRSQECWLTGKTIAIDNRSKGASKIIERQGLQLKNLQLGLAKATQLPFADNSQDLMVNSFLIDRLDNPAQGLREMYRVLQPTGRIITITPLNFQQATHWEEYYPANKFVQHCRSIGFKVIAQEEQLLIEEPLDHHGNKVSWNCIAIVLTKPY